MKKHSDVAQLAEQVAVNHRVVRSSRTVGAGQIFDHGGKLIYFSCAKLILDVVH